MYSHSTGSVDGTAPYGPGSCALVPPCLTPPDSHDAVTLAAGHPVMGDQRQHLVPDQTCLFTGRGHRGY